MTNVYSEKWSIFTHQLDDPLFRNSIFMMLSYLFGAAAGFFFWIIAAKFYSPADVGIATAIISSMSLIVQLSRLGMDISMIRYFPTADKKAIFNTTVIVTTFFSIFLGIIFIGGIDIISPELHQLKSISNSLLFIIFLIANSVIILTGMAFVAIRKANFQFIQNFAVGTRIIFLIPLVALGANGIFNSVGISFLFALLLSIFLLAKVDININLTINRQFLKNTFNYSAGNYLASLFNTAPMTILPIMVLNILGAEKAAYYYIAYTIAALLFMIPNSISMSLFVEGSNGENLKESVEKSLVILFLFLVPASTIVIMFPDLILGLIGSNYSEGGEQLLKIMALSSFFVAFNYIYSSIKRIQYEIQKMVIVNSIISISLILLSYILIKQFGIIGVGYAWLISYGLGSLLVMIDFLSLRSYVN